MFSFLSSALGGLSPYSLSTALQRQVLGFLLRRTLGHLVKDGQLDPNQIETGIGSGKIDISDVELDPKSVNELLAHVPISLAHGVIGRVSVQLPFPNLFNGDLSITVSGLNLVCDMDEAAAAGASLSESVRDLAESIASAADEAVKEDPEGRSLEASLEQSLQINEATSGAQQVTAQGGVISSIAASLLARLRVVTQDVRVRIRVGGAGAEDFDETPTELELRLESLKASTAIRGGLARPVDASSAPREVTRTLELGGVSLWLLAPSNAQPSQARRPMTATAAEDDSDDDSSSDASGDAYMEMSQAIPDLRATTDDLAQSSATMYASALDEASPSAAATEETSIQEPEPSQKILTLGSEPLVVRYSMVQEVAAAATGSGEAGHDDDEDADLHAKPAVVKSTSSLSVEVGTVAALLQLHQTTALAAAVDYLQSILGTAQEARPSPADGLASAPAPLPFDRASVSVAAIHVICAYESSEGQGREALDASISAYWARPAKAHPSLGQLRFKVEQIKASVEAAERGSQLRPTTSLSVGDVGLYEHLPSSLVSGHDDIAAIVPIVIFDASLPKQYDMPASVQAKSIGAVPTAATRTGPPLDQLAIDAVDWRRISGAVGVGAAGAGTTGDGPATPSSGAFADTGRHGPFWRTSFGERGWKVRPKHRRASSNLSNLDQGKLKPAAAPAPALRISFGGAASRGTMIEVAPLHAFADISIGARTMPLILALSKGAADAQDGRHLASSRRSDLSSSIATLHATSSGVLPASRPSVALQATQSPKKSRIGPSPHDKDVRVVAELVRIEVRAPACTYRQEEEDEQSGSSRRPAPRRATAGLHLRSGIAIIDLRGLDLQLSRLESDTASSPTSASRGVRFESERTATETGVEFGRISLQALVGFFKTSTSPGAVAFASLGKLSSSDEADDGMRDHETPPPLAPHLRLVEQASAGRSGAKRTFVDAHLPSLQICLSKPLLDGLELLADDATQWASELAKAVTEGEGSEANDGLKILGSRFFGARASMSLLSGSSESTEIGATTTLAPPEAPSFALALSEADVCLRVPRIGGEASSPSSGERLLALTGSELHVFVEPRRSSNSTLVDLRILNVGLVDHSAAVAMPKELLKRTLKPSPLGETQPMVRVHFVSLADVDTSYKESRIDVLLQAFCLEAPLDASLLGDVGAFVASPEGAFEHVEPNEVTRVSLRAKDVSVVAAPDGSTAQLAVLLGDVGVKTKLTPYAPRTTARLSLFDALVMVTDGGEGQAAGAAGLGAGRIKSSQQQFASMGFVSLARLVKLRGEVTTSTLTLPEVDVKLADVGLELTACADTLSVLGDLAAALSSPAPAAAAPDDVSDDTISEGDGDRTAALLASVDDDAFRRASADATSMPDLVDDDVPTDPRFLGTPERDSSAAVTLSEMVEEDFLGLGLGEESVLSERQGGLGSAAAQPGQAGGQAKAGQRILLQDQSVKVTLLDPRGIKPRTDYFTDPNLSPSARDRRLEFASTLRVRVQDSDVTVRLFAGYDLAASRTAINDEAKKVRRRLQKIKQLLDEGQTPDDSVEDATGSLFDSMHVSTPEGAGGFDAMGAMRAIDDELGDQSETASSASTWQPLPGGSSSTSSARATRKRSKLHRSAYSWIDFELRGIRADYDVYALDSPTASRLNFAARSFEIIDNVKTSTWKTFLTEDTGVEASQRAKRMVRVEVSTVRPGLGERNAASSTTASPPPEEVRMRAKLAPLRLHVDQDALDFLKKFFAFKLPGAPPEPVEPGPPSGPFIQHAEIFPIRIKLDYKPKRVNYGLIREGKTIELINFFHFDAAEMTLRHTTLRGVMGWPRLFDMLNDIWTPDVKANQLADVLSGIAPVRTLVNLGSGVADLVLLPIEQYQRDGKLVRGLQKGAMAFARTTALEAIKLGARLANGTQVILEQAEHVLGGTGGQVSGQRGETMGGGGAAGTSSPHGGTRRVLRRSSAKLQGGLAGEEDDELLSDEARADGNDDDDEPAELISRYAAQPDDLREGLQQAYKGLSRGLNDAAKTILAVPMEVYERGGGEAGSRPVVRAVPIAVLRGAAGASEAITKTLQGLQRELDPDATVSSEAKYKKASGTGGTLTSTSTSERSSASMTRSGADHGGGGAGSRSDVAGGSAAGGSSSRR